MKEEAAVYRKAAKKFKALSNPVRLKLMVGLMKKECCVGEIQKGLSVSQPNVSQNLKILKKTGLVVSRREKNRICYRIADESIVKVLKVFFKGEEQNESCKGN